MRWHSRSEAETRALGRGLGEASAGEGSVVVLSGPLGAGKTVFAQGVAEGLGLAPGALASPTFVIAQELPVPGGLVLVHADAYRLDAAGELESAGLDDWLAPGRLLLLEWGERFAEVLPRERLEVRLAPGDEASERTLEARARGPAAEAILARWRQRCP
jgi:tRNA threonylcarbamoyladenosine biosynthesis protein TsaE